jgi:hypothetical protein
MANLKTEAGRPKIFSSDVDKDATPEEKLWKAVLYQGVFEALSFRHNAIPLTDQEKKQREFGLISIIRTLKKFVKTQDTIQFL